MWMVLDNIFRLFYSITSKYVLVCAAVIKLRDFVSDIYSPLGTRESWVKRRHARRTICSGVICVPGQVCGAPVNDKTQKSKLSTIMWLTNSFAFLNRSTV